MAGAIFESERSRELLSQTILDVLKSWPEHYRRVFELSHYQGRSIDTIAASLGLNAADVRMILENCERRLRSALHGFRGEIRGADENPRPSAAVLSICGCFH